MLTRQLPDGKPVARPVGAMSSTSHVVRRAHARAAAQRRLDAIDGLGVSFDQRLRPGRPARLRTQPCTPSRAAAASANTAEPDALHAAGDHVAARDPHGNLRLYNGPHGPHSFDQLRRVAAAAPADSAPWRSPRSQGRDDRAALRGGFRGRVSPWRSRRAAARRSGEEPGVPRRRRSRITPTSSSSGWRSAAASWIATPRSG